MILRKINYLSIIVLFGVLVFCFVNYLNRNNELKREQIKVEILANEVSILNNEIKEMKKEKNADTKIGGLELPIEVNNELSKKIIFPYIYEEFYGFSSPFGMRESPFTGDLVEHKGLDMFGIWRAQIRVISDGVVVTHWPPPGTKQNGIIYKGHETRGGYIVVEHDNGITSTYSHLSETYISENQRVYAGQVIGRQGNTGKTTGDWGGSHLHFEIIDENEEYINPLLYLPTEYINYIKVY
jgi:murein DD-endopeptidase MepM/ murein hydrolase activator NlpD